MPHFNPQKTKNLTVFGPETQFNGVLSFSNNLVITGKFEGSIKATGSLQIEKDAVCKVDELTVSSVVVYGQVTGNMVASDRVEMKSGSRIIGDVVSARLRIEDSVDFQGQVTMIEGEPQTDLFSVPGSDFKSLLFSDVDTSGELPADDVADAE